MVGVFECVGESELKDYDLFGRVNGAAIIFPYIREHISGLSLKAGLGPIILPPVNFVGNQKK
jgi:preprotein translocase subunit SecB